MAEDRNRVARGPADHALIVSAMEKSFASVLQACSQAQRKARSPFPVTEAEWRHDHDRLFIDFFHKDLPTEDETCAIAKLYGSFERSLQMPHISFGDIITAENVFDEALQVQAKETPKMAMDFWAGADYKAAFSRELKIFLHLGGIWIRWQETLSDKEVSSRLGQAPETGRCDTLGTLRVPVPLPGRILSDCRLCCHAHTAQHAEKSVNATQPLELPIVLVEHKTDSGEVEGLYIPPKGAHRHRMCCTAATRFIEAVGITQYPLFSIICDGPLAMLTVAWADKEGIVHIAERHTEQYDISTPLGCWGYATVLCRLALWQSKALLSEFRSVEAHLVGQLQLSANERDVRLGWTRKHQIDEIIKSDAPEREEEEAEDAESEVNQTSTLI